MDVRNCKLCKNMFNYVDSPLCPACNKKMERKFEDVKKFIRENPRTPIGEVSEATEVPMQQLKKWVRQERLAFAEDSGITIDCMSCGKSILTGRYCEKCKDQITNSFSSMYQEKKTTETAKKSGSAKMRFLG